MIEHDVGDENYVTPSLIDKRGAYPVYRCFANMQDEARYFVREIKDNLLRQYKLKDIAVISKNKNQQEAIKDALEAAGIPCVKVDRDIHCRYNSVFQLQYHIDMVCFNDIGKKFLLDELEKILEYEAGKNISTGNFRTCT